VLWRAGLRISEALSLREADVEAGPKTASVRVLHGKGDKARTAYIDHDAVEYLDRWIEARRELELPPTSPLFCTLAGKKVETSYVRHLLPRLARKAGIAKRVHAHGLRHTHAAELRREGKDVGAISKQLGHSSIATTARYLDHIAPEDVARAIAGRRIKSLHRK
jgi:site-specific recombinase XerD